MKNLYTLLIILTSITFSYSQYAGNNVDFSWSSYVEVPDNANGLLDIGQGFTIEQWIKPDVVNEDQKTFCKLTNTLQSGYCMGTLDNQIKIEVFDADGNKFEIVAGAPTAGQWFHVAAVCDPGDFLKLYINGELVGETAMASSNVTYNLSPLTIVTESWVGGPGWLNFVGNIDETRFFQAVLTQEVIQEWMLRNLNDSHLNWDNLTLYHKYNEASGTQVSDSSPTGQNSGTIATGANLTASTMPFNAELLNGYTVELNGLWGSHTSASSGILSMFTNSIAGENSLVVGNDAGGFSFAGDAPGNYEASLIQVWKAVTNGSPMVDVEVDMSPISFSSYNTVAILKSDILNFTNATVFEGTLNGNTLIVPDVLFENGYYYTLGFGNVTSVEAIEDVNNELHVYPNPSNGQFTLEWQSNDFEDAQLVIRNMAGKAIYQGQLNSDQRQEINISGTAKGMYLVQIHTSDRIISKKVMIQ